VIEAVIFDMDGLLIDSEPLWEAAEMRIFPALGVPLTPELKQQTTGLRSNEIVAHWYARYPWTTPAPALVAGMIVEGVAALVRERGTAKDGAHSVLRLCAGQHLPLAIASSSAMVIIDAVLEKLAIRPYFQLLHSAENETYGKPHPAVYISTAQGLGVAPERCLAFEDSPNGVLAAKAAKMLCVAVPHPPLRQDRTFHIADAVVDSLADVDLAMLDRLRGLA
jgi:beta-phosphoglucomutase-like phosphatase (HAD superfamily)